ncbi:MAG: UDP-glucose 4-epimerase GalE [Microscillaceae bacterium]|nr:UDP-glucose 4-epimerase GalE [Microscillaceae bacterium]
MESKKIVVTGGTGYIGSHTVVELLEQNYEVILIDDLSNSNLEVLEGIEQITGKRPAFEQFNLCDRSLLNAFFQKHQRIDAIIHFAAFKAVGESVQFPLKYYHNNLISLIYLLECMQAHQIRDIVFSSSCTVYGQPEQLPVVESTPIQKAWSPYGNTKQICEEILEDTTQSDKNIKAIALRYFNPIGAHDSGLIGELPLGVPNNLVPFITQTAMGLRDELKVFGFDYDTPDGTCVRDYIHVVDLAKAHVIACERMLKNQIKKSFEYFNLGTGKGTSVLDAIHSFEKVSGQKLNYRLVDRRPGDVEQIYADTQYANEELGWIAERDLDNMMKTAWQWEQNFRKRTYN